MTEYVKIPKITRLMLPDDVDVAIEHNDCLVIKNRRGYVVGHYEIADKLLALHGSYTIHQIQTMLLLIDVYEKRGSNKQVGMIDDH